MSKLNVDQKTILELFGNKKADFLIPDYQRPYAWTEDECATLWDDICAFAIPEGNADKFAEDADYFLGPIVTFTNQDSKLEIIDGQQRLTTLMLLLRAFYSKFEYMQDEDSQTVYKYIATCIWKANEFDSPDMNRLKIDSEVASDDDKSEFLDILKTGEVKQGQNSQYARNFRFWKNKIKDFIETYPSYIPKLAVRILKNVILLPIEADSQKTALQIFSTLNDRGLPLSDADIFKSQFYKYYSELGMKEEFIKRWKELENLASKVFAKSKNNPMDELFTRYMYFERAKTGNKSTTTVALRDFYEKDSYKLLKSDSTFTNLELLTKFWQQVENQDGFSDRILRKLFVLSYAPNGMWTYLVSVYFMKNKTSAGELEENDFYIFLSKILGFIWAYTIYNPGVNALRSPVYPAMINIVNGEPVTFESYRLDREKLKSVLKTYVFSGNRPITKSMIIWWAFQNDKQQILSSDVPLQIEHIYPRRRAESNGASSNVSLVESLGNKVFLEQKINIRASDYKFEDKKNYYLGTARSDISRKEATKNAELIEMANTLEDFTEIDIQNRTNKIIDSFISYLDSQSLLV